MENVMKCTYLTCMNLNIFFNFYIYRIAKRIFHQNIVHNVVFAKNCNARTQLKMFSELNHPPLPTNVNIRRSCENIS